MESNRNKKISTTFFVIKNHIKKKLIWKNIKRHQKESKGINRNQKESTGITRNQKESTGIKRNQKESPGINRNQQESRSRGGFNSLWNYFPHTWRFLVNVLVNIFSLKKKRYEMRSWAGFEPRPFGTEAEWVYHYAIDLLLHA